MPLQASALLRSTTRGGELIGRHLPLPKALKQSAKEALIALAFARADGAIASYPKSGRTWLRFILANYFDLVFDLGLAIDLHSMFRVIPNDQLDEVRGRRAFRFERRAGMPFLLASHAPYRRTLFAGKTILFMLREPKDLMVSAYFHRARHGGGDAGGIKAFLRDPAHGLADYLRYSNRWAERLGAHRHLITSYERLAADTEGVAQRGPGIVRGQRRRPARSARRSSARASSGCARSRSPRACPATATTAGRRRACGCARARSAAFATISTQTTSRSSIRAAAPGSARARSGCWRRSA